MRNKDNDAIGIEEFNYGWLKDKKEDLVKNAHKVGHWIGEKKDDVINKAKDGHFNISFKDTWNAWKKIAISPERGAYLALINLNFRGHASHIKALYDAGHPDYNKIMDKWAKLGGARSHLYKAAMKGAKKKPIWDKYNNAAVIDDIIELMTAAGTILAAMKPLFNAKLTKEEAKKEGKEQDAKEREAEREAERELEKARQEAEKEKARQEAELKAQKERTKMIIIISGIGVLALGGGIFAINKL